jgi:hypothetical protein
MDAGDRVPCGRRLVARLIDRARGCSTAAAATAAPLPPRKTPVAFKVAVPSTLKKSLLNPRVFNSKIFLTRLLRDQGGRAGPSGVGDGHPKRLLLAGARLQQSSTRRNARDENGARSSADYIERDGSPIGAWPHSARGGESDSLPQVLPALPRFAAGASFCGEGPREITRPRGGARSKKSTQRNIDQGTHIVRISMFRMSAFHNGG